MLSGRDTISGCGPKGTFTDEEFKSFRDAILSYLSLCQANLEAEKNPDDLIAVIKAITEKNSHVKKTERCTGILETTADSSCSFY